MFTFQRRYLLLTILLFGIEVFIAIFVHDRIIRPYIGDVLVVILIYCFFKSFLNVSVIKAGIGVLLFSFIIEILQYFKFIHWIGLQHFKPARIIFGDSFSWMDLLAYLVGILIVFAVEYFVQPSAIHQTTESNFKTKQ